MFEQIKSDFTTLVARFGRELIEKNTTSTREALVPLASKGEHATTAEKNTCVMAFLKDLACIQKAFGLEDDGHEVVQNMISRYTTILYFASRPASSYNRGTIISSSAASRVSMASAARSTFFREKANGVLTSEDLKEKIDKICKTGEFRKKIIITIVSELKHYKNDSSRYKDIINHLETYLVTMLVRTDLPLNRLYKTFMNPALVKTNPRLSRLFVSIEGDISSITEDSFPLDQYNYKLIQEILPAIITTSRSGSVRSSIKQAMDFVICEDDVLSEEIETKMAH